MTDRAPLVSVVTPCYNAAGFLDRYVSCVLAQTYPALEVILVDDGSTDATPALAEGHRAAFEARGYRLVCLRQEHRGQAAAINRGLAAVTGAYVTWPDCDDLMAPDNIAKKVALLEERPELGFVCCQVATANEGDLGRVLSVQRVADTSDPWLFDRLIRDEGAFCLDIAYLARTSALFEVLGGRRIHESPAGQNYQLLLPLAWRFPCGFIDEPLATYVARPGSHSRSFTTAAQRLARSYEFEGLLQNVLAAIPMGTEERAAYGRYVGVKFLPQRFEVALETGDVALMRSVKEGLDEGCGRSPVREALALACRLGCAPAALRAVRLLGRVKARVARAVRGRRGRRRR